MNRLVTDDPQNNMEVMMNLAFVKDKEVWIRGGSEEGEDCTLVDFSKQLCMKNHECQFDDGFPPDIAKDDFDQLCDLFMECSMCGCPIGTMYFIAIQAAELRERLRVCEPINFHCMGFQDAEKILTYAGIGCDVLSPDGFIHWLKQQMIKDPRFMDELKRRDVKPE